MSRKIPEFDSAEQDGIEQILKDGVPAVNTESLVDASSGNSYDVDAAALLAAAGYSSGDVIQLTAESSDKKSSITNTSFTRNDVDIAMLGDLGEIPDVRLRHMARLTNDTAGETTTARAAVADESETITKLSELDISNTGTDSVIADSGWVTPTSITPDQIFRFQESLGKVSGGTGTIINPSLIVGLKL